MIALLFVATLGYAVHINQPPEPEDLPLVDPMTTEEMFKMLEATNEHETENG